MTDLSNLSQEQLIQLLNTVSDRIEAKTLIKFDNLLVLQQKTLYKQFQKLLDTIPQNLEIVSIKPFQNADYYTYWIVQCHYKIDGIAYKTHHFERISESDTVSPTVYSSTSVKLNEIDSAYPEINEWFKDLSDCIEGLFELLFLEIQRSYHYTELDGSAEMICTLPELFEFFKKHLGE
jgi:hypothetical protein